MLLVTVVQVPALYVAEVDRAAAAAADPHLLVRSKAHIRVMKTL